jgi:arachidonate 5-lipoxygenase
MVGVFVDQRVRCAEAEYVPIEAPLDPHPTRGDWINLGTKAYREVYGLEQYAANVRRDMPFPMPEDGFSERFRQRVLLGKAKLMFGLKALMTGRRATHMRGLGLRGVIRVVSNPEFPRHEFFQAGREFACRMRHANASFYDDASSQVRACSLKFADSDFASPLDLVMNTGVIQAFWNFRSFMAFVNGRVHSREHSWEAQREWLRQWPGCFVGIIESARSRPSSWAEMLYHTSIVYPFRTAEGRQLWAKYRLVPRCLARESGLLSPAQQLQPWVQSREAGDDGPREYLAEEYGRRLLSGPVNYLLQIQLREFDEDSDTWQFFNSARVWDSGRWPWLDLADVSITATLPDAVTDRMGFWLGHQPPSLGLTACYSPVDYRSLACARYWVYPVSRHLRGVRRVLRWQHPLPSDF